MAYTDSSNFAKMFCAKSPFKKEKNLPEEEQQKITDAKKADQPVPINTPEGVEGPKLARMKTGEKDKR